LSGFGEQARGGDAEDFEDSFALNLGSSTPVSARAVKAAKVPAIERVKALLGFELQSHPLSRTISSLNWLVYIRESRTAAVERSHPIPELTLSASARSGGAVMAAASTAERAATGFMLPLGGLL